MVLILEEQVLSEFPTEQQVKETHLHKLVISDIIPLMENLKVILTHGVRLLVVVVEQLKLIPQLMEQLQSVLDHLQLQHIVLLQ